MKLDLFYRRPKTGFFVPVEMAMLRIAQINMIER